MAGIGTQDGQDHLGPDLSQNPPGRYNIEPRTESFGPIMADPVRETNSHEVTQLLNDLQAGDPEAADRLIPLIYSQLHDIAARQMRRERSGHTLQTTALVHEAFLKLMDQRAVNWQNRSHFLGVASQAMRRILVDHARRKKAQRRGGPEGGAVTLTEDVAGNDENGLDLVSMDEALSRLAKLDPRSARVVELRFFGGIEVEEAATVLGVSPATVKRDWQFAKAWLRRELA